MKHRSKLDNNEELGIFAAALEENTIKVIEANKFTKDLALLVYGTNNLNREMYLNTFEFIDEV